MWTGKCAAVSPGAVARQIEGLGLVDHLADRFTIADTVEDSIRKIEAAEAGATHFWMAVHFADKERFMRMGRDDDGEV